jgi:hypothetical protein
MINKDDDNRPAYTEEGFKSLLNYCYILASLTTISPVYLF